MGHCSKKNQKKNHNKHSDDSNSSRDHITHNAKYEHKVIIKLTQDGAFGNNQQKQKTKKLMKLKMLKL